MVAPELTLPAHKPEAFLDRWVYDNPALADRRALFTRWLTDPTPREDIAEQLGIPLGVLLSSFNATAPLGDPLPFGYRAVPFATVAMAGTCDDIADGRWPLFGAPMTLRCYLRDLSLLPQDMVEAADWNFMDAGLPGFLGYLYGGVHDGTLYLAGLQSDLGVRYSYLFQGRGGGTEVRVGDDVVVRSAEEMVAAYGEYVPVLRRTFQRYWIQIMLSAAVTWAESAGVDRVGILRFPFRSEEDVQGHVVRRVYAELPDRISGQDETVWVGDESHVYSVAPITSVTSYLGARFTRP